MAISAIRVDKLLSYQLLTVRNSDPLAGILVVPVKQPDDGLVGSLLVVPLVQDPDDPVPLRRIRQVHLVVDQDLAVLQSRQNTWLKEP